VSDDGCGRGAAHCCDLSSAPVTELIPPASWPKVRESFHASPCSAVQLSFNSHSFDVRRLTVARQPRAGRSRRSLLS
jgi:hypothetical protein